MDSAGQRTGGSLGVRLAASGETDSLAPQPTLCEKLLILSPSQVRWAAQCAERKLMVALVWSQASCKLGLATVSSWAPQMGSVSFIQLHEKIEGRQGFSLVAQPPKNA